MIKIGGNVQNIRFHLAIPSLNIQDSMRFYSTLGCKIGRFTDKFAIIDFFGTQVVCHLTKTIEHQEGLYPRHFGLVLNEYEWDYTAKMFAQLPIEKYEECFVRYKDAPEEHRTFFIKDPSGNLIEFKNYRDERAI